MDVQLVWQVGTEENRWETIVVLGTSKKRKVRWRLWSMLVILIAAFVAGGCILVHHRYHQARRQITFQIQSVIDLEAKTLENRDLDLFLAQQDEASPLWIAEQAACVKSGLLQSGSRTHGTHFVTPEDTWRDRCPTLLHSKVQYVDLQGDIAWVEVSTGQDPVRQARFYRQTNRGWVHTAPRAAFWKDPIKRVYGRVTFQYHERDVPHILPLIEHTANVFDEICIVLECPPGNALEVDFVPDKLSTLSGDKLTLPSPWLSGIPVKGTWGKEYLDELTYWVACAMVLQSTSFPHPFWPDDAFCAQEIPATMLQLNRFAAGPR